LTPNVAGRCAVVAASMAQESVTSPRVAAALAAHAAKQAISTLVVSVLLGASLFSPMPAVAKTDGAAIGMCLITKAPLALGRCVTDPTCIANLLCIQTCTDRPDESTCQIKCGDEFANGVTEQFTKAAVSDKKCVPQRPDDGTWPVPKSSALVQKFDATEVVGDWYISAGLNTAFDTFDCQLHKFEAPSPSKLVGNLQWRIKDPVAGSQFVTRYTVQTFDQDPVEPGILYNHDNEFLHYQDDWFLLGYKPNEYFVVYYRGSNDAWDGYGGAVVYTRKPTLDKKYIPDIKKALAGVKLKWDDFQLTDNTCKPRESRLEEIEADLKFVETKVANGIFTAEKEAEKAVVDEVIVIEQELEAVPRELVAAGKGFTKVIVKDIQLIEEEVQKDIGNLEKSFKRAPTTPSDETSPRLRRNQRAAVKKPAPGPDSTVPEAALESR